MADNSCESQTFANVPDGFVKLLSFIVQVAMGPSVRRVFTLCQHRVNDSLTMHQAAVQFKGGRGELRRFRFLGRAMPTERHAMQMAARETIARLRDVLPAMKTRRYRYLPCHVPYTCHYSFSCPRGERDEAFEMLVEYLRALEAAFDSMVDDLVAARMDSVHGCAANRRELLHTAPPLTFISSSASHSPTILTTARRLPTTEEFNQAIAPTPVRVAPLFAPTPIRATPPIPPTRILVIPPTAPPPSAQHKVSRLEPISEEEVESPASLCHTLDRAKEILTISD